MGRGRGGAEVLIENIIAEFSKRGDIIRLYSGWEDVNLYREVTIMKIRVLSKGIKKSAGPKATCCYAAFLPYRR